MSWSEKSETVEPVAYFHRLKQYPYLEQLIKAGLNELAKEIIENNTSVFIRKQIRLDMLLGLISSA